MKKIVTVLTIMSMIIGCFGATSELYATLKMSHLLTSMFLTQFS